MPLQQTCIPLMMSANIGAFMVKWWTPDVGLWIGIVSFKLQFHLLQPTRRRFSVCGHRPQMRSPGRTTNMLQWFEARTYYYHYRQRHQSLTTPLQVWRWPVQLQSKGSGLTSRRERFMYCHLLCSQA